VKKKPTLYAEGFPPAGGDSLFLKNSPPMVSVVIPAYHCAQYLPQALASVFRQTYLDYETIVINDGSPDTHQIEVALRPYGERIRYFRQRNRGPAAARNRGIVEARGKFIAFLDADDSWAPEHLAKQMAMLEQDPELELVYSDWILLKNEKPWRRAFVIEPQAPEVTFDSLLQERSNIGTSTVVVSRAAILAAGCFDENLLRCEDFEMWLRIAFTGAHMAYHPDVQVYYRCNEVGLSADHEAMTRARILVYQKIADTLPLTPLQHQMINHCVAWNEADFHISEMKHAIAQRMYKSALESGSRAEAIQHRWKLSLSLLGLRIAPGLFRLFHLARVWFLNRRARQAEVEREIWSDWGSYGQQVPGPEVRDESRSTTVV
jgi:glycosyltransferase involved in cell wall biosynthesis